jgi:hypothetical protein
MRQKLFCRWQCKERVVRVEGDTAVSTLRWRHKERDGDVCDTNGAAKMFRILKNIKESL